MQDNSSLNAIDNPYTVIPLENPQHLRKIKAYMQEHQGSPKTSFCRFWLRGICIMKSEHCQFAHDFNQLDLSNQAYQRLSLIDCDVTQKTERKKLLSLNADFHQKPLFFIDQLDYTWLHAYQSSPRFKKSGITAVSLSQLRQKNQVRRRIRQIMHREQWDHFIDFLERHYPEADFTISMCSNWFTKLGFEKTGTDCKFGDFMRYMVHVRKYHQVYIVVPPLTTRSVYFLGNHKTYLYSQLARIKHDHEQYAQQMRQKKRKRALKLPQNLHKRFVCRYYMSGNCQFSRQECVYLHCFDDLRYDPDIIFEKDHRQAPKSKQDRINYISLYNYYQRVKSPQENQINLQDLNSDYDLKDRTRRKMHLQIYSDFLQRLHILNDSQMKNGRVLAVRAVREAYQNFGFNHTDENKFGQLVSGLWEMGYYQAYVQMEGKKEQCIIKVPDQAYMDQLFKNKIAVILEQEIGMAEEQFKIQKSQEKNPIESEKIIKQSSFQSSQLLQSSIRRLIYASATKQVCEVPLHVYLRAKKMTLKQVLQAFFPQYCSYIIFESGQQSYKQMGEYLKKFFKKQKKHLYQWQTVDTYLKSLGKDQLNFNCLPNYTALLELALLQLGKHIFFWPIANSALIIDPSHPQSLKKPLVKSPTQLSAQQLMPFQSLFQQSIIVVDNLHTFQFCQLLLQNTFVYGVDLQGKLCQNGYIDFVQVSCFSQRQYIFIIDIFSIQKRQPQLLQSLKIFLKKIFEDRERVKVLHASQQDAIALKHIMNIDMTPVFDTAGMHIYLQQKQLYAQMHSQDLTFEHTLRKIKKSKAPGLNSVLQAWHASHGPNQYKQLMKEKFVKADRSYFEHRPIPQQFLMYSARDVQDLVEIYQKMQKYDTEGLWPVIGQLYSCKQTDL